jgi:hypothetical protein
MQAIVARLRARLDGQEGPRIELEHRPAALRFTADEWRPTLVERVNGALDDELGPGERARRFKPF